MRPLSAIAILSVSLSACGIFIDRDERPTGGDSVAPASPADGDSMGEVAANQPPSVDDLTLSTPEDTPLTLPLSGADPEGGALSFVIVVDPMSGWIPPPSAGELHYNPNRDFHGQDSFFYAAYDDEGERSAAAKVTINVTSVNDVPIADYQNLVVGEDGAIDFVLTGHDTADGDTIVQTLVVTHPDHGSLIGTPPYLTYEPSPDHNGYDSLEFIVSDGQSASGAGTIWIEIVPTDDVPSVQDDAYETVGNVRFVSASDGEARVGSVLVGYWAIGGVLNNDHDIDRDPLTVVDFDTVGAPLGGTVDITTDGTLTYDPPAGQSGVDSFSYTLTDGTSEVSATVSMTVTEPIWFVDNTAPPGDGRWHTPFNSLGDVASAGTDAIIYVYEGSGPGLDGGVILLDGQQLIGNSQALFAATTAYGTVRLEPSAAAPTLSNSAAPTIKLADGNSVRGFVVFGGSPGILGVAITGANLQDINVLAAAGDGINIDGSGALDLTGIAITNPAGRGIVTNGVDVNLLTGSVDWPASGGVLLNGGAVTLTNLSIQGGAPGLSLTAYDAAALDQVTVSGSVGAALSLAGAAGPFSSFLSSFGALAGAGVRVANTSGSVSFQYTGASSLAGHAVEVLDAVGDVAGAQLVASAEGGALLHAERSSVSVSFAPGAVASGGAHGIYLEDCSGDVASAGLLTIDNVSDAGIAVINHDGDIALWGNTVITNPTTAGAGIDIDAGDLATVTFMDLDVTTHDADALILRSGSLYVYAGDMRTTNATVVRVTGGEPLLQLDTTTVANSTGAFRGIDIGAHAGQVALGVVDIDTDGAEGLYIDGTGYTSILGGNIDTTNGRAIFVNQSYVAMSLGRVTSSDSPSQGIYVNEIAGQLDVTDPTSAIVRSALAAMRIENLDSNGWMVFAGLTISERSGHGVELIGGLGGIGIGELAVSNELAVGGHSIVADGYTGYVQVTNAQLDGDLVAAVRAHNGLGVLYFGTLDVTADGGMGIDVSQFGGLAVFNGGDIVANDAVAVKIDNAELGVYLTSVSSEGGGSGIDLDTVTGSFSIRGDGPSLPSDPTLGRTTTGEAGSSVTPGSGGTITNSGAPGILINDAGDVGLSSIVVSANDGAIGDGSDGILATNCGTLTLDNVLVEDHAYNHGLAATNVGDLRVVHSEIRNNATADGVQALGIWNVRLDEAVGLVSVEHSELVSSQQVALGIENASGTASLTITDSLLSATTDCAAPMALLRVHLSADASAGVTVVDSEFSAGCGHGIALLNDGSGVVDAGFSGNTVSQVSGDGVHVSLGGSGGQLEAHFAGLNNIDLSGAGTGQNAVFAEVGQPGNSASACLIFGGADVAFVEGVSGNGVRVEVGPGSAVQLEGYVGAADDVAEIETFLDGAAASVSSSAVAGSGTIGPVSGPCPTLP